MTIIFTTTKTNARDLYPATLQLRLANQRNEEQRITLIPAPVL